MHDDGTPSDSIGKRVARARKRRALTQHGLADRSNYSRSHIAQVEAGHKVATPAFIAATASALAVDPTELYGQPYRGETVRDDKVHAPIPEIRRALAFVDVAPDLQAPPRPLDALTAELAIVRRLQFASRHVQIGARLPGLLEELTWHAYETEELRAWRLLFRAHEAAADLCRKLGYHDLASNWLERAKESAQRSQDPHLPVLVVLRRSLLLAAVAQWRPALTLLSRALRVVDHGRDDADEVAGTAHLRAAIVAARSGDSTTAWDHYGQAVETRDRAGSKRGDRHGVTTNFTSGNVSIHGAAVAVDLGDLDEAARRDRGIGERLLSGLVPERRAHHEIDMARVHVETGDRGRALERLLGAERIAPQMTRYHPSARAVVGHLVDVRREIPEPLRGIQSRMHIA